MNKWIQILWGVWCGFGVVALEEWLSRKVTRWLRHWTKRKWGI